MINDLVSTPVGTARITWYPAPGTVRAIALLGHGSATGIEAPDLQALAAALPPRGITVALVTQPYRHEGNPRVADENSLDRAWTAVWRSNAVRTAAGPGLPIIAGGRSAGSQVACRTAAELGAHAVLALAYPLLGPGSARELLSTARPTLIVQGGSDSFGRPADFPPLPPELEMVEIPFATHTFGTGSHYSQTTAMARITDAVTGWMDRRPNQKVHP